MPSAKAKLDRAAALAAEVRAYCAAHADPSKATKWARYFTEGYDAWGILDKDAPLFNEQQNAWLEQYSDLRVADFLRLGAILFQTGKYEEGAMAIRFLKTIRDDLTAADLAALGRWFEAGIRNWAHTDVLCGEIIAPVLESGGVEYTALASWCESPLKFQRRAVPVALLGPLKDAKAVRPFLEFVRPLMADSERVVHQGLGWFLREAWKKHPKPVEAFLMEWKDTAARLIFQYATEKMTPAQRARFKAAKRAKR